jgi:murein DD-endopeptidase MepM/ murein hydrolase activator NlpD
MAANPAVGAHRTNPDQRHHTVAKGDTLSRIAKNKGVSLRSLIAANPDISNPDLILPGQKIQVPGASTKPTKQAAASRPAAPSSPTVKTAKTVDSFERKPAKAREFQAAQVATKPENKTSGTPGGPAAPDASLKQPRSLKDQAALYDKYFAHVPKDKRKTGSNEMNIVGVRHHDKTSSKKLRSYDDRFLVLWKDGKGNKRAKVYQGSTHTGQTASPGEMREKRSGQTIRTRFTDVNGDKLSDIAWVKPGTYSFRLSKNRRFGQHLRAKSRLPAWRDTNQDGRITGAEANGNHKAAGILFHAGGKKVPISVGCQTMKPEAFKDFMKLLKSGASKNVNYTLVGPR